MSLPADRLPWAFGYQRFGNDQLPAHLLELAKARANSAVRAADFSAIYLGTETTIRWLDAAVHAGSAIEILAKYYLSTVSAVLLLDNTKLQDSDYLHAVGRSDLVPPEDKYRALNLRTRGPKECLDLIGLMTNKRIRLAAGVPGLPWMPATRQSTWVSSIGRNSKRRLSFCAGSQRAADCMRN
jgi:hypothetical protein